MMANGIFEGLRVKANQKVEEPCFDESEVLYAWVAWTDLAIHGVAEPLFYECNGCHEEKNGPNLAPTSCSRVSSDSRL